MIYYISGLNARQMKIEKIRENYENVSTYDLSNLKEYEKFLDKINNVSIFPIKELLILKRVEKFKKVKELLQVLKKNINSTMDILVDYYVEYKNKNVYLKDFEKIAEKVVNIEKEDDLISNYILENLNISKTDVKKLLEIIGTDFNHVKNEIYKYNLVLGNDKFSITALEKIMTESTDKKISSIVEKILYSSIDIEKMQGISYMAVMYSMYIEIEILHKIIKLGLSLDYKKFSAEFEMYKNEFQIHPYVAFLKLKGLKYYDEKSLIKILNYMLKNEIKYKSGKIDEKTMMFNVISYVKKNRKM